MESESEFIPDYTEDPAEEVGKKVKSRYKSRACPMCNEQTRNRINQHIGNVHLPWYADPFLCCFTCKVHVNTATELRHQHGSDCPGHSEDSRLTDKNIVQWASWMYGLLVFLCGCFPDEKKPLLEVKCLTMEELRALAENRGYFPQKKGVEITPHFALCLRMLDRCFEMNTSRTPYQLTPPSSVAVLAHWSILGHLIVNSSSEEFLKTNTISVPPFVRPIQVTIDAHAHLDTILLQSSAKMDSLLKGQGHELILAEVVCSLAFPDRWDALQELSKTEGILFTMGLHPHKSGLPINPKQLQDLEDLLRHPNCVGLGEVGVDLQGHSPEEQAFQWEWLGKLVKLAVARKLPLVLHVRSGYHHLETLDEEVTQFLAQEVPSDHPIYLHCFVGSSRRIQLWTGKFSNMFFGLGSKVLGSGIEDSVLREIPLQQLLLESDAPYLLKRPLDLGKVVEQVARVRNLAPLMLCDQAWSNAARCFGIPRRK